MSTATTSRLEVEPHEDLLEILAKHTEQSVTVPNEIREAWLREIQALNDEAGSFDAARVRARVPEECKHGQVIGAIFRELSKKGLAYTIGATRSGYSEHRATNTLIPVWKLADGVRIWPERSNA